MRSSRFTPILINPVSGASNRSIQSYYGGPRDGGRRRHEGIDIFARKGTPVIAPAPGRVTRVGTSPLGGKVVWMTDSRRGHAYYFAHLDSQYVRPGQRLGRGDTLGTVGNTGNARSTPPHLHFGIYQAGSKDPIHYVRTLEQAAGNPALDTSLQVRHFRTAKRTVLRKSPRKDGAPLVDARKDQIVLVIAQSGKWYRVALPDQRQGYAQKVDLERALNGEPLRVTGERPLLIRADTVAGTIAYLTPQTRATVLGRHAEFSYVRTENGQEGWLYN